MKTIVNPYIGIDGYRCFGCSPDNPNGLRMSFFEDGDDIVSLWQPEPHYQGYSNVLHGGIQATLLDEIASWVVFVKLGTSGVTSKLSVKYIRSVFIGDTPITLRSRLLSLKERRAFMRSELYDSSGRLSSSADAEYSVFPEALARRKFHYPGQEAFYGT